MQDKLSIMSSSSPLGFILEIFLPINSQLVGDDLVQSPNS